MDVLGGGAGDLDPAPGMHRNQIVLRQRQNRLTHRCAAQAQHLLKLGLVDKLSRDQLLLQDHGLDLVVCDL